MNSTRLTPYHVINIYILMKAYQTLIFKSNFDGGSLILSLLDEDISFSPISTRTKGLGSILSWININNMRLYHRCKYIWHLQPPSCSFDLTHRCIRTKTLHIRLERRICLPSDRIMQTSVLSYFSSISLLIAIWLLYRIYLADYHRS